MHMHMEARGIGSPGVTDSCELLMWMLGTELGCSGKMLITIEPYL